MSNIDKGILIFNEWMEAMKCLPMNERAEIIYAIYDLQINNIAPPKFSGTAQALASVFFPCIERRRKQSERGLASAAARRAKQETQSAKQHTSQNDPIANDATNDATNGATNGAINGATNGAINQRIIKNNKIQYNIEERSKETDAKASTVGFDESADADALALYEAEKDDFDANMPDESFCTEANDEDGEFGYGRYRNVHLSNEEYLKIKQIIPDADGFIESFSQKLHDKGYRYPNHAKAILDWYYRDAALPANRLQGEHSTYQTYQTYQPQPHNSYGHSKSYSPPPSNECFPTLDELFELAVRRSLGNANE